VLHVLNSFDLNGQPTYVPSSVMAPTYGTLFKVNVPRIEDIAKQMGLKVNIRKPAGESGAYIHFPDLSSSSQKSLIYVISADSTKNIIGYETGASWIDECSHINEPGELDPKNSPLVQIEGRVRNHKARWKARIYTWTPEGVGTYIEDKFSTNLPGHKLYQGHTADNPYVKETYKVQVATFNKKIANQYLLGIPEDYSIGRGYPYFNAKNIKDVNFHPGKPLCMCWDFGASPGNTLLLGSYDPDLDIPNRVMHIVEEFHEESFCLKDALVAFESWFLKNKHRFKEILIFGDASGTQKSSISNETSYRLIVNKIKELKVPYKMKVKTRNPAQRNRLHAFNCACDDMNGIHLYVNHRCTKLIKDIKSVKLDEKGGIDKDKKTMRNISHLSDAASYFVEFARPVMIERNKSSNRVVLDY